MEDETKKYLERIILRLDEIIQGKPFQIRPKLQLFNEKLKEVVAEKETTETV